MSPPEAPPNLTCDADKMPSEDVNSVNDPNVGAS